MDAFNEKRSKGITFAYLWRLGVLVWAGRGCGVVVIGLTRVEIYGSRPVFTAEAVLEARVEKGEWLNNEVYAGAGWGGDG